jgi:hypothetical protein
MHVEPLPKHAEPGDLRYSVIRWSAARDKGLNGRTHSVIDPRSGEILRSTILLDALALQHDYAEWNRFLADSTQVAPTPFLPRASCEVSALYGNQAALLRTAMVLGGTIGLVDPLPAQIVAQRLRKTVTHEVGHALGLRHNFRASAFTPVAKLTDVAYIREHGVTSSIMDYPSINLPATPKAATADFPYYSTEVGEADLLTITFGYAPDEAQAAQAARDFVQRGFSFSTDNEADDDDDLDPLVNKYDLGDDPLAFARGRAEFIRGLWPELPRRVLQPSASYTELTEIVFGLLQEYYGVMGLAVKYIGGRYHYRDRVGDPGGRLPFMPVDKAKQREALALLSAYLLGEQSLRLPNELLLRLGGTRSGLWLDVGHPSIDTPVYQILAVRQQEMLLRLTSNARLLRMLDSEFRFGEQKGLTVSELFDSLSQSIFSEVLSGAPHPIGLLRRALQQSYLDRLSSLLLTSSERVPVDVTAIARHELSFLLQRIEQASRNAGPNQRLRMHLSEVAARIKRSLDAPLISARGAGNEAP